MKPNTKAMLFVVQFLMMIYSPTMFRKKFRWPITNKIEETDFR